MIYVNSKKQTCAYIRCYGVKNDEAPYYLRKEVELIQYKNDGFMC